MTHPTRTASCGCEFISDAEPGEWWLEAPCDQAEWEMNSGWSADDGRAAFAWHVSEAKEEVTSQ